MRLFIGVKPPPEVLQSIRRVAQTFSGPRGREVETERLHLTLHFLGDVDESLVPTLLSTMEKAKQMRGSQIVFDRWLAFPDLTKATVAGLGCSETSGNLQRLQSELGDALEEAGFAVEKRAYVPHLTLFRYAKPAKLGETATPERVIFPISRISLFRSHLGGTGPRYEELARHPLQASYRGSTLRG